MFMMPWIARLTRSRLPLGVILLVLINLFVFFALQSRDEKRYELMVDYYAGSVLPNIELPAFEAHLRKEGEGKKLKRLEAMKQAKALFPALRMMEADDKFMRALHAGEVVTDAHLQYEDWLRARHQFEAMQARLFTERFSFDGEHPKWYTAITHQFLHGDLGHITGNLVVLILIAPAVEALLGTVPFLVVYLLGGLGAVGMHWLLMSGAAGSLVGASGAISAVMGAFAVLLGMRRIPFFYFVFFYFDVVKAPALLALPLWLANEAIQFVWFSGSSNVAYGAHFGGLLAGALLVLPLRRAALARLQAADEEGSDEETADGKPAPRPAAELAVLEARRLMAAQRFDDARRAYARVAREAGSRVDLLRESLNVARLAPASAEYHAIVASALASKGQDAASQTLVRECFTEYLKQAKPRPQLAPELIAVLIERFAESRSLPELERCARLLQASAPAHPGLDVILARCVQVLRAGGALQPAMEIAQLRSAKPM
ncbi:rhomboid family intramembrane serine protease [Uliginosibacterium aquaticum]|uniref:Rhomboid family intramembrane serine protease n=1 Tax=Uliginosibacterium aquaticum TaxID=2731212 RepID=A0ABX2INE8_9RHOO|nr:rhomboid family intramembrane serine protease [Uliginosibacterium aquaticum]NSL55826.1 rhomboid family intramembrane serine protease [Uliginosibacterium aquaticum]